MNKMNNYNVFIVGNHTFDGKMMKLNRTTVQNLQKASKIIGFVY